MTAAPHDFAFPYPSYPDLDGRVALVTGGSSALGAATARLLAANGARVAVNGRDRARLDAAVAAIGAAGGVAVGAPADVTDAAAVAALRRRVEEALGPIDVLCAFAGGNGAPEPTLAIDPARWRAVVDLNLGSLFLVLREVLPGMVERRRGAVVTMASTAGRQPGTPGRSASAAYAAAKAGAIMLTRHVANEVAAAGVRVNCISPSAVRNERMAGLPPEALAQIASGFPLGRIGEPDDVALAALYLASDASSWVTGQVLDVTGGRVTG
jgi:NAD(P)-dependent dehydrogenase (short-subunit alcohol dehydrogenase family)